MIFSKSNLFLVMCLYIIGGLVPSSVAFAETEVRYGTLDNGFGYVILNTKENKDIIATDLIVKAGRIHEGYDQVDVAHLVEHIKLAKFKYSDGRISLRGKFIKENKIPEIAVINGTVKIDRTAYTFRLPYRFLDDVLYNIRHVISENNQIEYDVFKTEKLSTDAEYYLGCGNITLPFPKGLLLNGGPASPRDMIYEKNKVKIDGARFFQSDWYHPESMVLAVAGDIDVEAVERRVRSLFGSLPPSPGERRKSIAEPPFPAYSWYPVDGRSQARATLKLVDSAADVSGDSQVSLWAAEKIISRRLASYTEGEPSSRPKYILDRKPGRAIYIRFSAFPGIEEAAIDNLAREIGSLRLSGVTESEVIWLRDELRSYEKGYFKPVDLYVEGALQGRPGAQKRPFEVPEAGAASLITKVWLDERLKQILAVRSIAMEFIGSPSQERVFASEATMRARFEKAARPKIGQSHSVDKQFANLLEQAPGLKHNHKPQVYVTFDPPRVENGQAVMVSVRSEFDALKLDPLSAVQSSNLSGLAYSSGLAGLEQAQFFDAMKSRALTRTVNFMQAEMPLFSIESKNGDLSDALGLIALHMQEAPADAGGIAAMQTVERRKPFPVELSIRKFLSTGNGYPDLPLRERVPTLEKARQLWRDRFSASGSLNLRVSGNYRAEQAKALIEKYFEIVSAPSKHHQAVKPKNIVFDRRTFIYSDPDIVGTNVAVVVPRNEPGDSPDAHVVEMILRDRLNTRLREIEGLAYAVLVHNIPQDGDFRSSLQVNFTCAPENAQKAVQVVEDEIRNMQRDGLPDSDLVVYRYGEGGSVLELKISNKNFVEFMSKFPLGGAGIFFHGAT